MHNDFFKIRYKTLKIAVSESTDKSACTNLHNHDEFEMLIIEEGKADFNVSGKLFSAEKGDIVLINPGEVHAIEYSKKAPYKHLCICFDLSLIPDKALSEGLNCGTLKATHLLPCDIAKDMAFFYRKIYENATIHTKESDLETIGYLSILFANLLKTGFIYSEKERKNSDFAKIVCDFIRKNLSEPVTSRKAAELLNYNHSYFCRAFRKNFGTTFSEYLMECRISQAKIMLEQSDSKVSRVAEDLGFNTPDYFSRSFKKYVGVSPFLYKKSQ